MTLSYIVAAVILGSICSAQMSMPGMQTSMTMLSSTMGPSMAMSTASTPSSQMAMTSATLPAGAQKTTVVTVGSKNNSLIFSPDNIKVPVGEMVQFQFVSGNHTVTQSTFDNPCQPLALHSNTTGLHSGFQPAAASAAMGMISTYTIRINDTKPLWLYCAQGKHCENGMVMVMNENTAANASRSLANYKALAKQAITISPGAATGGNIATGSTSGTGNSSTGTASGSGTLATSGSGAATSSRVAAAGSIHGPSAVTLLGVAAAALSFL